MAKDDEVIDYYLNEIKKIPLLTPSEELELAKKAKNGDISAKEKIVKSNLRFVITIAKKYQNHGLDLEDLISEGNIGLLIAIEKFEPSKGYKFISYAVWWIRQSILRAISDKGRMIRIPVNKTLEITKIKKAFNCVYKTKSEQNEFEQVAKMLNLSDSYVKEMLHISGDMISLDQEIDSSDSSATMIDFIEDKINPRPEDECLNNSLKDELDKAMSSLKPVERRVLRMRYGLDGEKEMSLQEIGDRFNLTKERIRQIEKKAIVRMQHPVRKNRLEVYVA
ncbi:MAG: RNA polymerase sigma factor RpoD/SigA [Spirochaetia bacterium]|nr:RNA polymerase sigma factor RpoD/SigA [Spirochaetia bacterium]MCI7563371.1 RNA polymerase sigma factor RpoD/SigA [Spirochaetia bacterium]